MGKYTTEIAIFALGTALKLLLIPSYFSTDFEVHRNWLAITHSLPVSRWYYDQTSPWTLDYPPFFAWFEWLLSHVAAWFDPEMLRLDNLNYASPATVLFQRLSVIVSDAMLIIGISLFCNTWPLVTTSEIHMSHAKTSIIVALTFLNPGLLIVDHIHFQYNGFLLGILLVAVALIRRGRDLEAGVVFAALIMFKHIFLYTAPLFFVYLLRHYCYRADAVPLVTAAAEPSSSAQRAPTPAEPSPSRAATVRQRRQATARAPKMPRLRPTRRSALTALVDAASELAANVTAGIAPTPLSPLTTKHSSEEEDDESDNDSPHKLRRHLRCASSMETLPAQLVFSPSRFLTLAGAVAAVFAIALLPILWGDPGEHGLQLLSRLFPFKRGLCHAYWAPNIWALYSFADKALARLLVAIGALNADMLPVGAMTGGLVTDAAHLVLPSIRPFVTVLLTLFAMLPVLADVWRTPHPRLFLSALVHCTMCSFMFGWHVHEKAILMVLVPLSLMAVESRLDAFLYVFMSAAGNVALFPLLFTPQEEVTKVALVVTHMVGAFSCLDGFVRQSQRERRIVVTGIVLPLPAKLYLVALAVAYLFMLLHPLLFRRNGQVILPFLPLMLLSVTCAVGLVACWVLAYKQHLRKLRAIQYYQHSPQLQPVYAADPRENAPTLFMLDD